MLGLTSGEVSLLDDDQVGRELLRLFDADRASLMTQLVLGAVAEFGVDCKELHNDSTSVTCSGAYRSATGGARAGKSMKSIRRRAECEAERNEHDAMEPGLKERGNQRRRVGPLRGDRPQSSPVSRTGETAEATVAFLNDAFPKWSPVSRTGETGVGLLVKWARRAVPQWSPVSRTGETPLARARTGLEPIPQWSPVSRTGETTTTESKKVTPCSPQWSPVSRTRETEATLPRWRRVYFPRWSPVSRTGETLISRSSPSRLVGPHRSPISRTGETRAPRAARAAKSCRNGRPG